MNDTHLIRDIDTDKYYTHEDISKTWTINPVPNELTIDDFINYGMEDLSVIPEDLWAELGDFEILTYTESEVAPMMEIMSYSFWEDTGLVEPLTKEDFEEYGMETLEDIPAGAWAELGDFEILTWSNKEEVPEIEIEVPEFRLIDELEDDNPEILCYVEGDVEPSKESSYSFIPDDSYYKYRTHINDPRSVEADPTLIIEDWQEEWLTEPVDTMITVPPNTLKHMNPYPITVEVEQMDKRIDEAGTVQIYNTNPTIFGKMTANTINLLIGDPELDDVKTTVSVNGVKIFTQDFKKTPYEITHEFKLSDYIIGENNIVLIEVEDQFELLGTLEVNFIGDYYSLIFCDGEGQTLSTDKGEVIERIDFGVMKPGRSSLPQKMYIQNRNPYKVKDVEVKINKKTVDKLSKIEISKTESPFVPEEKLIWSEELKNNAKEFFYTRIITDELAIESPNFQIVANAIKSEN